MKNSSFLASPLWALASTQANNSPMAIICGIFCGLCLFMPLYLNYNSDKKTEDNKLLERIEKTMLNQ